MKTDTHSDSFVCRIDVNANEVHKVARIGIPISLFIIPPHLPFGSALENSHREVPPSCYKAETKRKENKIWSQFQVK